MSFWGALCRSALPALLIGQVAITGCVRESGPVPVAEPAIETGGTLSALSGRFLPDRPVTAVPDRFWEVDEESQTWSFRGWANLLVFVADGGVTAPVEIRLTPAQTSDRMHFEARWDEEPVAAPRFDSPDGVVLKISEAVLSPGLHRLTIGRNKALDDPDVREVLDCRFDAIEVVSEESSRFLDHQDHRRYEFLRSFLEDGVTGNSKSRYAGMLVSGTRTPVVALSLTEKSKASFMVAAFFAPATRFTVDVAGVEHHVDAGNEPVEFELSLNAGVHELRLRTDGPPDGLYLWGSPRCVSPVGPTRGPVILVTLDTTRRDALSVYGGAAEASPNIADFAETATVFDDAWSTSPWTLPSHASLFTGLYPTRHGAGVSRTRLDSPHPTLAELARSAGFRTVGFSAGALSASRWGLSRGFDHYRDPDGFETIGDRQTEYVLDAIDRWAGEPLFIFVNYFDPHAMYRAPPPFEDLFSVETLREKLEGVPGWEQLSRGDAATWRAVVNGEVPPTADALAYLEAAYLAEVAFMDHQLGRVFAKLVEKDLYESSTIILVADHGELLGEDDFFGHACRLDPELTEIPLIIKWPGETTSKRDDRLVSQVDLFGTVLDALGVEAPSRDGIPIRADNRSVFDGRTTVFMEEHANRIHPLFDYMAIAPHLFGLQTLDWRQLVWNGGTLCYDRDPAGWTESSCDVEWQQRMEELASVAALPVGEDLMPDDAGITDEMREHLEALGYIR